MSDPYASIADTIEDDPYGEIAVAAPAQRPSGRKSRAATGTPGRKRGYLDDVNSAFEQAADWATLGLFGNYRAAVDTAGARAGAPGYLKNPEADFLETKQAGRDRVEDFNRRRPVSGVISKTVGGVAPALVSFGTSNAVNAARAGTPAAEAAMVPVTERAAVAYEMGKKPLGFAARRARDAVLGAEYGGIVGANEAVGKPDFDTMRQDVGTAALTGAIAGPVFGTAVEGVVRAAPKYGPYLADESGTVSFGEFDRAPVAKPTSRDTVARENLKLAKESNVTPKEMMETTRAYEEAGTKPLFAELLKRRGLQRGRNLANMPGQTPDHAEQVIKEQHGEQVGLLRKATTDAVAGEKRVLPRTKMAESIEKTRVRVGKQYDPLFEKAGTTINPEAQPDIAAALQRIPDSVMDDAIAAMEQRSTWRGADPKNISEPRKLWYIKKHLDNVIAKMEKNEDTMLPDVIATQKMLIDGLEKGLPGYKGLNAQYSEVKNASEALKWGQDIMLQGRAAESPEEVATAFNAMSKREQAAAKSGFTADLLRMIEEGAGAPDAPRNAAAFMRGSGPAKARAILKGEAEPYLRKIATLSQGYRNRSFMRPGSGSNTYASQAEGEEMFLQHPPTKQGITRMVDEAVGDAWTRVTTPIRRGLRDKQGKQLFTTMSSEDVKPIAQALDQEYGRRRYYDRYSRGAGGVAGQGGYLREDRQ